jgi:hypothetical protein
MGPKGGMRGLEELVSMGMAGVKRDGHVDNGTMPCHLVGASHVVVVVVVVVRCFRLRIRERWCLRRLVHGSGGAQCDGLGASRDNLRPLLA